MSISFSGETKEALCAVPIPPRQECCRTSLLYGLLMFADTFKREKIRLFTAHQCVADFTVSLMDECFALKANLYESEKKNGGMAYTSYKITEPVKKNLDAMFAAWGYEDDEQPGNIKESVLKCQYCLSHFLRGAFLCCGSVHRPESSYQLEFTVEDEVAAENLRIALLLGGFEPHQSKRKQAILLYFKESEIIVDLLNFIGAQKAAFQIINTKILKDLRNNANRAANCDTANINKAVAAAKVQIDAIMSLEARGTLRRLSAELTETAALRVQNPDASLAELAALHDPPVTKSGVTHRLAKLVKLSNAPEEEY